MSFRTIVCEKCSNLVELIFFTNTCECGTDYNKFGDMLADRSQWGYETGESVSSILAIDREGRSLR